MSIKIPEKQRVIEIADQIPKLVRDFYGNSFLKKGAAVTKAIGFAKEFGVTVTIEDVLKFIGGQNANDTEKTEK